MQELNADLVASGMSPARSWTPPPTSSAIGPRSGWRRYRPRSGVTQNGTLALGQAVFVPSAARITTVAAALGAPAAPGQPVLTATSTTREVTIALDAAQQSEVKVGDKVTITLPDNQTTPGWCPR